MISSLILNPFHQLFGSRIRPKQHQYLQKLILSFYWKISFDVSTHTHTPPPPPPPRSQPRILVFVLFCLLPEGKWLSIYQIIRTSTNRRKYAFGNIVGYGENAGYHFFILETRLFLFLLSFHLRQVYFLCRCGWLPFSV